MLFLLPSFESEVQVTDIEYAEDEEVDDTPLARTENLVSPLRPLEYEALKDSIRTNGVIIPVLISDGPTKGRIIDGFHRMQACEELDMDCPKQHKVFDNLEEEDATALLLNAQRRQLDDYSGGLLNMQMMKVRGIPGRGRRSESGYTTEMLAKELGLSITTFWRRITLAKCLSRDDMVDIKEAYQREELTNTEAVRMVKTREQLFNQGKNMSDAEVQLNALLANVQGPRGLPPTKAARVEGFAEGLRWGYKALKEQAPNPNWVEAAIEDWRASVEL